MGLKKLMIIVVMMLLFVVGCGGSEEFTLSVENDPYYHQGELTEIVLLAEDENGEPITGLSITGKLEMEKMDHGLIEVAFKDNGDGTYTGEVELPMGGEWIMDTVSELDGKEYSHVLRFQVNEG